MNKNRYVIEVNNHGNWVRSLNLSSISGKSLTAVTFSEEAALREVEFQKSTNGLEYRFVLSKASVSAQKAEEEREKFNGLVIQSLELLTSLFEQAGQRLEKLEAEPVPTPSLVETPRTVLALERIANVLEARLSFPPLTGGLNTPSYPNWVNTTSPIWPSNPITPTCVSGIGQDAARLDTGWQTP